MTNPPILTIDKEGLAGIIATGKPAGLYMAKSEAFPGAAVSAQWTGVDSRPGHLCLMKQSFPTLLRQAPNEMSTHPNATTGGSSNGINSLGMGVTTIDAL